MLCCETRSCHARRQMILKDTATFQVLFIVSVFLSWNITTVEINSGVHFLKSYIHQMHCLLTVVLVLLFRSWYWSCKQRSWSLSWSCYFHLGLGLKNLVLFISVADFLIVCPGNDDAGRRVVVRIARCRVSDLSFICHWHVSVTLISLHGSWWLQVRPKSSYIEWIEQFELHVLSATTPAAGDDVTVTSSSRSSLEILLRSRDHALIGSYVDCFYRASIQTCPSVCLSQ